MRQIVEPTLVHSDPVHGDTYEHPAYGMIGAARVNGSSVLVGSDFKHNGFVVISIKRAQMRRNLSRFWFFGRKEIVEVALSEAQWVSFITQMNVGDGVPCTIKHTDADWDIPGLPLKREMDFTLEEVQELTARALGRVNEAIAAVEAEVGGVPKRKRGAVLANLELLRRDLGDSLPFMAKSFGKHVETMVEKGKTEVYSWMNRVIYAAGLDRLANGERPLELGSGDEGLDQTE